MIIDKFLTIKAPTEGEYKEKGSKFLAYAFPMSNEEKLIEILNDLRGLHPKARHFCYAYKLGINNDRFRIQDDGEPSGTAGKPIFGQLLSFNITNIIVVVVRYFGGTKLGASGLTHAYKEATLDALLKAEIINQYIKKSFLLRFSYENMGHIMNVLKDCDIEILEKSFTDICEVKMTLRLSEIKPKIIQMKARIAHKNEEEIDFDIPIELCEIIEISEE